MSVCLSVYGSALARAHARKLWNALKLEIFQPIDLKTEEQALKTTQDIVKIIYSDRQQAEENVEGLAKDACEECLTILREPEKSQAKHAIKVLCAFMSTTPSVSQYTIAQVVPYLMRQFVNPEDASVRPSVLLLVSDVIAAARDAMSHAPVEEAIDSETVDTPLTPFKDELVSVIISALKVPSCRSPATACLLGSVSIPRLLAEEDLGFIVHNVNEVLNIDDDEEDSNAALKLLSTIALSHPRLIRDQTLPQLFSSLPDHAPPKDAVTERVKYWRTLEALTTLCHQSELFEILVIRLTTRLDLLCFRPHPESSDANTLEPDAAYAHSMIHTIHKVLAAKIEDGHPDVAKYVDILVPRLFNLFLYSVALSSERYVVGTEPRLMIAAGQVITLVVQSLPSPRQETYAKDLVSAFVDGTIKPISEGQRPIPADHHFRALEEHATTVLKNLVILFSSAMVALRKEIVIPVSDLNVFLSDLLDWSLGKAENDYQRESIWKMIAAISNKRVDADATAFLSQNLQDFWASKVADTSCQLSTRQHAIQAWGWMAKALLIRTHAMSTQFTDRLFELFAEEGINWHAAKTFGDIVSVDKVLTKKNHAVVKILHTQRFVDGVLPRLISGAKNPANSHEQFAYLVALCSLISQIPRSLYGRELPLLIPLLIRGLDLPDHNIRCKVIGTLLAVAQEDSSDKSAISEHAPSLVTTMLKNSVARDMSSVNVRISALKYLGVLPKVVRYDVLHPHKATVLRELSNALDDPKRLVRREAVETRTTW
ncbi:hypothetical protein AAF712_005804 [Marasmius tenuissimus]|uniref:MMS19 nucleotide excision repair protein n=1 Tax=Marasmius tenuissimus TaxID=585030 RepID=A0ABR3A1I3_9AGAR